MRHLVVVRPSLVLFVAALLFSACSGVRETDGQPQTPRPSEVERVSESPAAETFDPSVFPVQPPQRTYDVQHEVPQRLLQGEATRGLRRTIEGFRIQIFSTTEKAAAERVLVEARNWWERARQKEDVPSELFAEDLAASIEYRQPYYRVRIGRFVERQEASQALQFVQQMYKDAFIVRGLITVTR